jgi:hypothetical protein
MVTDAVLNSLDGQARACTALGSPFSGAFLLEALADIETGGPAGDLYAPFGEADAERHIADATALRFLGAFHDLALSGDAPMLSAHYPRDGAPGDAAAAWATARELIGPCRDGLAAFMTHEPQTNEVGRSGVLLSGYLNAAARTRLPLRTVELGASAGLNTIWDQFGYDLDGVRFGDAASPVQLRPDWRGPPPVASPLPDVAARLACDRRPLDLTHEATRRRLMAYIWPDQLERLQRLRGAIALAQAAGVAVEAADAADFIERECAPRPGVTTVICHSVFWQYMPAQAAARARAAIERHGVAATAQAPLAWVRLEPETMRGAPVMGLRVTLWPGAEERLLARSHPHGTWIEPV